METVEKKMQINGVTTEELTHALYAVKVALDQSRSNGNNPLGCDCDNCKRSTSDKSKMLQLAQLKYNLGLMGEEEAKMFLEVTQIDKQENEIISSLSGFYDKMSDLIPAEEKEKIEAQSDRMMAKVLEMKSHFHSSLDNDSKEE